MKWFHNTTIGKFIAVGFATAVHAVFALGAYRLGELIMSIILYDVAALQKPAAVGYAILTFAGAIWGFVYFQYAYEEVKAYSKWFLIYLYIVQVAIAGSELSSLALRAYETPNQVYRIIIIAAGLLFLLIAYCLGKVIHAMANKPVEASLQRVWQDTGRSIVEDALTSVPNMSVEQKKRFYNGDLSPVDEVRNQTTAERDAGRRRQLQQKQEAEAEKRAREEQKQAEKAAKREASQQATQERQRAKGITDQMLSYDPSFGEAQVSSQVSHLSSQNGSGSR